jgi:hypothetical protein
VGGAPPPPPKKKKKMASLTGHVDAVEVDVDGGPPEHGHDRGAVLLLDLVLEDDLVWKADPALARVVARKHARAAAHLVFWGQCCDFIYFLFTLFYYILFQIWGKCYDFIYLSFILLILIFNFITLYF